MIGLFYMVIIGVLGSVLFVFVRVISEMNSSSIDAPPPDVQGDRRIWRQQARYRELDARKEALAEQEENESWGFGSDGWVWDKKN